MVYMVQNGATAAIAGSSELLLFDCDKFITSWDFDQGDFRFIQRSNCIRELRKVVGNADIPEETFVDACLLAGSQFLPTLPILESPQRNKMPKPLAAMEMIWGTGRTGITVVQAYSDDPRLKELDYLDNYRKARMTIKHQSYITKEGRIENRNQSQMPNDANEFIGQRLPDELYHYLSRGFVDPRLLTWRAVGEIIEVVPADGGDSVGYRDLVSSKLIPHRKTALNLLSSNMHYWFQHHSVTVRCWFPDVTGKPVTVEINMGIMEETRQAVGAWYVREERFGPVVLQHKVGDKLTHTKYIADLSNSRVESWVARFCPSRMKILFPNPAKPEIPRMCVDPSFSDTATDILQPLSSEREVLYNSIWRFLALRDYVDTKHNLTAWGKMLATVISGLKGNAQLEEAAVLAVELLRLDMLNGDASMFPNYNGSPLRGDPSELHYDIGDLPRTDISAESDRKYALLISRLSGLGTLHHKAIGFTGPLSKSLLGYNSVIKAVRGAVRDIVEVGATHIFLTASTKRANIDFAHLGVK
jgi:hypothetical protein